MSEEQRDNDSSPRRLWFWRRVVWTTYKTSREFFFSILNLISFGVNFAGPYRNLARRTDEAPTLFRPVNYSFSIWIPIYILLALFVFYSFFRRPRKSALVRRGVFIFYFLSVLFCIGWGVSFSQNFTVALVMLVLTWVDLAVLMVRIYQYRRLPYFMTPEYSSTIGLIEDFQNKDATTIGDFWFVQVPFSLYFGWITAALLTQANIVVTDLNPNDATKQLTGSLSSLLVIVAISAVVSLGPQRGDAIVSLSLAWASLGIGLHLQSAPPPPIFAEEDILLRGFRHSAYVASLVCLVMSLIGGIRTYRKYRKDTLQGVQRRNELIWRDSISRHLEPSTGV